MKKNSVVAALTDFRMFIILLMGISSGLPLALTGGTLQAWMRSEGVDLSTIGLFAFVGMPYTLKFLWAPLMDRFSLPILGRRKGWMLLSQILLIGSVLALGFQNPQENLWAIAACGLAIAFFSASQDIVVDAWRREALDDSELGLGSSVHVTGYLFAFRMISGGFALFLSDLLPWSQVYQIMALVLVLGLVATLLSKEPNVELPPRTLKEAVILPFVDFFKNKGAILVLLFILLYKLGDNMAAAMTIPFYLDVGFTRTEVGAITKLLGWLALAGGGIIGGLLLIKYSMKQCLIGFGILQAGSTFGFALLQMAGHNNMALSAVIGFENFTAGMGTAAFAAYMASVTNKRFTATQYALLTSFMGIPRTFMAAPTGFLAEGFGWFGFFLFCTLIAVPGLLMIPLIDRLRQPAQS